MALAVAAFSTPGVVAPANAQAGPQTPTQYTTLNYGVSGTFLTGIRGDSIVGNYVVPGTSATGGLLYNMATSQWSAMPVATANGVNYPDAIGSSPYGPSFGNQGGVLRTVGSYITSASSPYDLSYLYDGAAAPGQQITPLAYPSAPGNPTLYTIAHSTFGDTVVGNYDTRLVSGNAMIYTISTGAYTTNNKPGAASTTVYGVYGDMLAGGYAELGPGGGLGFEHGYLYNKITGTWTTYHHPEAIITHLEGITSAGRSGEYNMVADWVTPDGVVHAGVLHVNALGIPTWHEINIPGATLVSSNSAYQDKVVGIYLLPGSTTPNGFIATIPGIYNPIRNTGAITFSGANAAALSGRKGDDIVNSGSVQVSGNAGVGIRGETYGVLTNSGAVTATGIAGAAVEMHGVYGTLLNSGVLQAPAVADALRTGPDSFGTVIVNTGVIDGRIAATLGPQKRFENSGWIGVTGSGPSIAHFLSGTYAQTASGVLSMRVGVDGHDTLGIAGVARLGGTLEVPFQTSSLLNSYTLLSATGGTTGAFNTLATWGLPTYVSAALAYSGGSVTLNLTSQIAQQAGLTPNQAAVGGAVDNTFNAGAQANTGNTTSAALGQLYRLDGAQLGQALGMMSGEIHAALPATLYREGDLVREAILDRFRGRSAATPALTDPNVTRALDPAKFTVWGEGIGAWGRAGSDGNAATVTRQTGGFLLGAEVVAHAAALPSGVRFGVAGGYLTTNVDADRLLSHGRTSSIFGALYAGTSFGPLQLSAGGLYTGSQINTNRSVQVGAFSDFANVKQDASSIQAFGEAGYKLLAGQGIVGGVNYRAHVEPFVNAAAIRLHVPGFTENGGDSALSGFNRDYNLGIATVGARFEARFGGAPVAGADVGGGQFVLRGSLGWRAAFGDVNPAVLLAFRSSLQSQGSLSAFEVSSVPVDRGAAVVGAGIEWQVTNAVALGVSYAGQFGQNVNDQTLKGRFDVRF